MLKVIKPKFSLFSMLKFFSTIKKDEFQIIACMVMAIRSKESYRHKLSFVQNREGDMSIEMEDTGSVVGMLEEFVYERVAE